MSRARVVSAVKLLFFNSRSLPPYPRLHRLLLCRCMQRCQAAANKSLGFRVWETGFGRPGVFGCELLRLCNIALKFLTHFSLFAYASSGDLETTGLDDMGIFEARRRLWSLALRVSFFLSLCESQWLRVAFPPPSAHTPQLHALDACVPRAFTRQETLNPSPKPRILRSSSTLRNKPNPWPGKAMTCRSASPLGQCRPGT